MLVNKLLSLLTIAASSLFVACSNPSESEIRKQVSDQIAFASGTTPKMCYAPIVFYRKITDNDFQNVDGAAKAQGWVAQKPYSERFITIVNASDEAHCPKHQS